MDFKILDELEIFLQKLIDSQQAIHEKNTTLIQKEINRFLSAHPTDEELRENVLNRIGLFYQNQLGEPNLALEIWDELLNTDGYSEFLWKNKMSCYQSLGLWEQALASFLLLEQREFSIDYLFQEKAEILRKLGRMDEAEQAQQVFNAYQKSEEDKWSDPNYYYNYK
jgi:tetratricopeptide (TPR) repeat protein